MEPTHTYTEQTRLRRAAEQVVERARKGLSVGAAIDHLADVLRDTDAELCRACLHPTASGSVHAACVRERELVVAFLRRHGAYALANRVSADHHVFMAPAAERARPLSESPKTPKP